MKFELNRGAHKVFKIKYHFVVCIKYRKDLFLQNKYTETMKTICKGLEERYHLRFETLGFDEDHVHFMLESLTTTYSPAKVFQIVKSITAIKMFEFHKEIKEELWGGELWGGELWSDGGYVGTVGEGVNADIIRDYISKQGRKIGQLKLIDFT